MTPCERDHDLVLPMNLRTAYFEDLEVVARLLCEGFWDDPGFCWAFPKESFKKRWLERVMRSAAEIALGNAQVVLAEEDDSQIVGMACWYYPTAPFPPPWQQALGATMRLLPLLLYPPTYSRYQRLSRQMMSLHPAGLRCWRLSGLVVRAEQRGKGLGSRLVEDGVRWAAEEQVPVFLQTWGHLLPFYERHGFSVVSQFSLPGVPGACYGMVYDPAANAADRS